jgi:hypothetical protein
MVSIEITRQDLVVRIRGWDRVRALRSTLSVPLAHVTGVRTRPREAHFDDVIVESWRGVGTYRSGSFAAGSVFLADGRAFYDVHDPEKAIAIDLTSEPIRRVVVEVGDEAPEVAALRIRNALARRVRDRRPRLLPSNSPTSTSPRLAGRVSAWKVAFSLGAAIVFAPVGALAALFVVLTLAPLLLFVLPMLAESGSARRPCARAWRNGAEAESSSSSAIER